MLERKIVLTNDGSSSIYLPEWDEHYHSKHGAINEAEHVFINQGLKLFSNQELNILEIGFGTGLNALLTLINADDLNLKINYEGVEAFPVETKHVEKLNYISELGLDETVHKQFLGMHENDWEEKIEISNFFSLTKRKLKFKDIDDQNKFDLIYFDAFGSRVQPELWTEEIFEIMFNALKKKGVLVTYSAKGSVRRALQKLGFMVERLPGPPGKREMLRATK